MDDVGEVRILEFREYDPSIGWSKWMILKKKSFTSIHAAHLLIKKLSSENLEVRLVSKESETLNSF